MTRVCLTVYASGAREPREHRFEALPITIGRDAQNDVQLRERFVSSFHARIEVAGGGFTLLDLGSTNGTHVRSLDGSCPQRIDPRLGHRLRAEGDEFMIGRYRIALAGSLDGFVSGLEAGSLEAGAASLDLPPPPGVSPEPLAVRPVAGGQREADPSPRSSGVAPEDSAAAALGELERALAPGLDRSAASDAARLVARMHAVIAMFCQHFARVTQARRRQLEQFALPDTPPCSLHAGLSRLEAPDELAALLLDFRGDGAAILPELERSLTALLAHDVAVLDGVMSGVGALLKELAPERLETELGDRAAKWPLGSRRAAALWEAYRRRHARLSAGDAALARVFGRSFARAYGAYLPRHARRAG